MKQLTKEQHEVIYEWLDKELKNQTDTLTRTTLLNSFLSLFPPSCCDSCADGEHCESDHKEIKEHESI